MWWYEGFAEVGGRFDLNIRTIRRSASSTNIVTCAPACSAISISVRTGAAQTRSISSAWGKNIGWDDQAFGLDFANPGTYYLTFGWDETPHVFWKNAKTLYNGVGTNNLTIGSVS